MPRKIKFKYRMRVLRKKYAEGLERGMVGAIYSAYSRWNRKAYRVILETAPRSKTPSQKWPIGSVSGQIKLVTKRKPPYMYEEVDVPGKHSRGSRAWKAWVIIKTLHEGWKTLPFVRKPKKGKVLRLPLPGGTIFRSRAIQRGQITFNPWIIRAWETLEPEFPGILKSEIDKKNRAKKKEKVK